MADQEIHQSIKGASFNQPYLQWPYRLVTGSAAPVDVVKSLLHSNAAALEELGIERCARGCAFGGVLDLPEQNVVARDRGGVGAASVLQEEVISVLQDFLGPGDTTVEIFLVGLI